MSYNPYQEIQADLKPCPFCGKIPKLLMYENTNLKYWFVRCDNCCDKELSNDKQKAIDCWNQRATDS